MSERTNETLSLCHARGNTFKKVSRNERRRTHCRRLAFFGNVKDTAKFHEFCYQMLELPESPIDREQTGTHNP